MNKETKPKILVVSGGVDRELVKRMIASLLKDSTPVIAPDENQENPWRLTMDGLEIRKGHAVVSKFGWGSTPEEAIKDYSVVISGQPIVFGAHTDKRSEFTVPALTF